MDEYRLLLGGGIRSGVTVCLLGSGKTLCARILTNVEKAGLTLIAAHKTVKFRMRRNGKYILL